MNFIYRCGQETRVVPRILQLRQHWVKSEKENLRLIEAGITREVLNNAIAQFCLEIIVGHGEAAPRLCNKDPLTLKMGTYITELFPNVSIHLIMNQLIIILLKIIIESSHYSN